MSMPLFRRSFCLNNLRKSRLISLIKTKIRAMSIPTVSASPNRTAIRKTDDRDSLKLSA
jgi:hypothetical protein